VSPPPPDRRGAILDAAFNTFCRYGYRKTSMEDVARAAEISRQALYGHFPDRDALFRECMKHGMAQGLAGVDEVLARDEPIATRLVHAFDEYVGRNVEKMGADFFDLGEQGRAILGTLFSDTGAAFEKRIVKTIGESSLAAACKKAGVTPKDMAETLHACAKGWKTRTKSRADFVAHMEVAVKLVAKS
jgi:AcrR family transcriptional regulator